LALGVLFGIGKFSDATPEIRRLFSLDFGITPINANDSVVVRGGNSDDFTVDHHDIACLPMQLNHRTQSHCHAVGVRLIRDVVMLRS